MAIAYVNKGAAYSNGATTNINPSLPASVVANNLLLAIAYTPNGQPTHSWGAGWTQIGSQVTTPDGGAVSWGYRIATGSDSAPSITYTGSQDGEGIVFQFSGTHATNAIPNNRNTNNGSSGTHTVTGITSTADDSAAVYLEFSRGGTTLTTPSGYTAGASAGTPVHSTGLKILGASGSASGSISTAGGATAWAILHTEVWAIAAPLTLDTDLSAKALVDSPTELWPVVLDTDLSAKALVDSPALQEWGETGNVTAKVLVESPIEFPQPLDYSHDAFLFLGGVIDSPVDANHETVSVAAVGLVEAGLVFIDAIRLVGTSLLPPLESDGQGTVGTVASAAGTFPLLQSSGLAHSTVNVLTLSALTASGVGLTGQVGTGAGELPMLTGSGTALVDGLGAGDVSLASLTTSGAAKVATLASGGGDLPGWTSAGAAQAGGIGAGSSTLGSLTASGTAFVETVATGAAQIPLFASSGAVQVGSGATASQVVLGSLTVLGHSWSEVSATGAGILPLALGAGVVVVGESANRVWVVMNAGNGAVTEFADWIFDSIVEFNGEVLLAGPAGIAVVGGALDGTAAIAASITSGKSDHGTDGLKRVTDAYLSFKTAGRMQLTVTGKWQGRETVFDYDVPYGDNELEARKVDLGRGFKSRHFQYTLANCEGADFTLEALAVLASPTGRRA